MLVAERRDLLMARLHRDGKLIARDLAAELGLSEDIVRRDLRELAAAGLCQRVYGGAVPISPSIGTTHLRRAGIAADSKRHVAARAAYLITPGSTVILDGDTTGVAVAEALRPDLTATIITNSPPVATALIDHPSSEVYILGGPLHKQYGAACGAAAAEAASTMSADLYLLVAGGIHPSGGLTVGAADEAALKRILISRAAETYVLASREKIGTVAPYTVTGTSDVAGIITDAPADDPTIQQLRQQGCNIIHASGTTPRLATDKAADKATDKAV